MVLVLAWYWYCPGTGVGELAGIKEAMLLPSEAQIRGSYLLVDTFETAKHY